MQLANKVVRPKSSEQKSDDVTDFIKQYDLRLSILVAHYEPHEINQTIRFWFPIDTRIFFQTITLQKYRRSRC